MAPYVRSVKTASGATAVQIVYSSRCGARDIEHIGWAHDDAELAVLKAAAQQRTAGGQGELDLGLDRAAPAPAGGPSPITSSRTGHLCDALDHGFRLPGFEEAAMVMRCSGNSCWPASSSRPASWTGPGADGTPITAQFVIDAYRRLFRIEKSFRMSTAACKPARSTTTNATPATHT
jgi:hypothetical protein